MKECLLCFTYPKSEYYQPEWSDIPTRKIWLCSCGALMLDEDLPIDEEWQFISYLEEEEE